ncbi:MAG: hypothetical protein HY695_11605 [Deltaproteobacteria bacterium]|nr:hypothetical protein [Deltaproteobacteria bacterium]
MGNREHLPVLLDTFVERRKALLVELLPGAVEQVHDPRARELLRRLASGRPFHADRVLAVLEGRDPANAAIDDLDDEEAEKLASDVFYSWICGTDYVRSLYRLGVVALGVRVPEFLAAFLQEARSCYGLQQQLATVALCRSALEAALRDVAVRKGLFSAERSKVHSIDDDDSFRVRYFINRLSKDRLKDDLHEVYGLASNIVHGKFSVQRGQAEQVYGTTVRLINALYERHRM